MLTINKKQLDVFSDYMRRSFEKNAAIHLRKKFPLTTKAITHEHLEAVIKEGIDKAANYNIIEREDVLPYIEYMICLGNDFDINPLNVWAKKVLIIRNLRGKEKVRRMMKKMPLKPKFN